MKNIKKGNIVARKSHNKDILFIIKDIIEIDQNKTVLLNGLTVRITADAPIDDLEIVPKEIILAENKKLNNRLKNRIERISYKKTSKGIRLKEVVNTGKILHLDGDRKYTDKSYKYYKKLGLNAVVKYIPEYKQPIFVKDLLLKYNPDILVITRS